MAAPTELRYTARCRFCGMQPPAVAPFVSVIGQAYDPRLVDFVMSLQSHLEKKHGDEFKKMQSSILLFTGFSAVRAFEVQDPLLVTMQEQVRAQLHRGTRRAYITDEEIHDRIVALGFTGEEAEGLNQLLQDMRNLLCEEGPYAPAAGTKTLVTL
jgi:hypothetical protein